MFPTEVAEILGVPSKLREIVDEATCHYHFERPLPDPRSHRRDEHFIEVKIHWTDGRTAVTAARLAASLLGGGSSGFREAAGHRRRGLDGDDGRLAGILEGRRGSRDRHANDAGREGQGRTPRPADCQPGVGGAEFGVCVYCPRLSIPDGSATLRDALGDTSKSSR